MYKYIGNLATYARRIYIDVFNIVRMHISGLFKCALYNNNNNNTTYYIVYSCIIIRIKFVLRNGSLRCRAAVYTYNPYTHIWSYIIYVYRGAPNPIYRTYLYVYYVQNKNGCIYVYIHIFFLNAGATISPTLCIPIAHEYYSSTTYRYIIVTTVEYTDLCLRAS